MAFSIIKIRKQLRTLLFPPRCLGCDQQLFELHQREKSNALSPDWTWCNDCLDEVGGDLIDRCYKCGAQTHSQNPLGNRCRLCHKLDLRFERAICLGDYRGKLQELIIQLKREKSDALAIQLGRLVGSLVPKFDLPDDLDMIVPIPMTWSRRLVRGFHASNVIAQGVERETGLPINNRILRCTRSTKKQGRLNTPGRFKNVKGAFSVRQSAHIMGKKILLIDDVMTSGATVGEAAKILIRSGAAAVFVGVIARGARVR